MKHKLESRLLGEVSITSDMQITPLYGRKQRRTKESLESERGERKSWLKTQHSKTKITVSPSIFHEVMGLDAMILVFEC